MVQRPLVVYSPGGPATAEDIGVSCKGKDLYVTVHGKKESGKKRGIEAASTRFENM